VIGEISYDLVMEDDMKFVEAAFRLENAEWQVIVVSKRDVPTTVITPCRWQSGVSGLVVRVPRSTRLNRQVVGEILARSLGVETLREVRGPDYMSLR